MRHQTEPAKTPDAILARLFAAEVRVWKGNARLSTVFWLHGVLASSILILVYATTVYQAQLFAEQFLLICFGFYTIFILVSIWRCSLATDTFWGQLARFLTFAWAANAALVLSFRQLELLILFAGVTASSPGL